MKYWVVKAKARNLIDVESIKMGDTWEWWGKVPPSIQKDDRLLFWKNSPDQKLYALGSFVDRLYRDKKDQTFKVKFSTGHFQNQLGRDDLTPLFGSSLPTFLRGGPAGTLFLLEAEEARAIYDVVVSRNPAVSGTWHDLTASRVKQLPDVDVDLSVTEGNRRLVAHLRLERNSKIVNAKKKSVLRKEGKLECEICGFDFVSTYGEALGSGYCEVHHLRSLADTSGDRTTKLRDLAIVCSNCHRMIHRRHPMLTISKLKRALKR